jgi:sporulation protein YlmC with PRC-barrel domain
MLNIDNIMGKTVISANGSYIGEIYNIDIDPGTWQVTHLKVKLCSRVVRELGLKRSLHRHSMRVPTELITDIGVIVRLSQPLAELSKNLEIVRD